MKSFLIIGLSTYGKHLCKELARLDNEIMIADKDSAVVEAMVKYSVSAKICDCTNPEVLESFGADEFDCCFVCLGNNFTEALEISYLLKELGARKVITEVNRDLETKFLLRNGADEAVYPELDAARRIAAKESSDSVFNALALSDGYSVYETETPERWCGESVKSLNVRAKYNINILATKNSDGMKPMLSPEYVFNADDHLIVMCHENDIRRLFHY
ncbi:MAG: TrkA family potassium uptake protein [Clostridia bacterium]|nr:TrkA family potassium uptake protein [Clostridia bacterium]